MVQGQCVDALSGSEPPPRPGLPSYCQGICSSAQGHLLQPPGWQPADRGCGHATVGGINVGSRRKLLYLCCWRRLDNERRWERNVPRSSELRCRRSVKQGG